ncbi:MAG: AMP-binding protein, partial [Anaerolineae bacterium]|nr:AMP-binding protein [Anaerolineae bacterium]
MKSTDQKDIPDQMRLGHLPEELENFDSQQVNRPISARLEDQVEKTPDLVAVHSNHNSLSYRELNHRANRLARSILAMEEGEDRPVVSLFGHDQNSLIAFLGILKTGRIFVPLDPTYTQERLRYSLQDSQAAVIVTDSEHLTVARSMVGRAHTLLNLDDIDPGISTDNLELPIPANRSAVIHYTSGSTGAPKGVVSDHRKLNHRALYFTTQDRLTHLFSMSFIASIDDIFGALMHGAGLYMYDLKREGLSGLAEWLISEKITYFRPPSSILAQFNDALPEDLAFPDIQRIALGAQAVYTREVKRLMARCSPGCVVKFHLASTEAGRITQFHFTADTLIESERLPVGYPAIGMEIIIMDDEGRPQEPGQVGEIVLRSAYLAKEYWRDPTLTAQTFKPDPRGGEKRLLYTGDLGRMQADGLLEHFGRKDLQVKIRGYRIEVAAIEAHLQSLGAVKDVVVAPFEPPKGGDKYLIVYIVPQTQPAPSVTALRDSMKNKFAEFMIPSRFVILENLPRTTTGKIDLTALPAPAPDRPNLGNPYSPPTGKLEKQLGDVWERVLRVKPVGIEDNFFDLGGDSLLAAQLFIEIERQFDRKLPLSILYQAANVKEQAAILARRHAQDEWSPLVAVQPKGEKPPLFCFPGKGGNPIRFRHLSQRLGQDQPVYMLQSTGLGGSARP